MSALSYEVTTGIADGLGFIRQQYNSSVINVVISLGILVENGATTKISELTLHRNGDEFKVWNKSNGLLFHVEMYPTGAIVETFKRGIWEELLEKLSKDRINDKKDESERSITGGKVTKTRKSKARVA